MITLPPTYNNASFRLLLKGITFIKDCLTLNTATIAFGTMLLSREFVVFFLLGAFALAFGRVDVGKALGRARASLKSDRNRGKLLSTILNQLPIKAHAADSGIEAAIPRGPPYTISSESPINNHVQQEQASPPAVGATPCQTAEQWEGRGSEWDHILGNNDRFNISFDGINRRKRIIEDAHAQLPGKRIYEYIMLYNEGIQYVINHNYNTCTIQNLGTWRNFSIPANSTLEDHYEIGAPGNGFMVQEWSDRIPGRQKESWIGTFTDEGCWPVNEIFMEKDEKQTMIQSVSTKFFDLKQGIASMSVFTPPPICNQAQRPTTPEPQSNQDLKPVRLTIKDRLSVARTRPTRPKYAKLNRLMFGR